MNKYTLSSNWEKLENEFNLCSKVGFKPSFWIRDDDATDNNKKLDKLLILCQKNNIPISLASIPFLVKTSLIKRVNRENVSILVHGYKHQNYASLNKKKSEFSDNRPQLKMIEDIKDGLGIINNIFGTQSIPVFVPPWNRICNSALEHLSKVGIIGFSGKNKSPDFYDPKYKNLSLIIHNADIDLIDWKFNKKFAGECKIIEELIKNISYKRKNLFERNNPICILSHHKDMEVKCFEFIEKLFIFTNSKQAAWLSGHKLFGASI